MMEKEPAESLLPADWESYFVDDSPSPLPEKRVQEQMDGLSRLIALKPRARILDLGCGSGQQTLSLARCGYRVLGLDSSVSAVAQARAAAKGQGLNVHFLVADACRIPYHCEFDAVVSLRTPIGSWGDEDDLRCLKSVHKALKPHGKLFLDLLNREWLIRRIASDACERDRGVAFDLKLGRLRRPPASRGERPLAWADGLRIYSLTEIVALLAEAGFALRKTLGSFDGSPYGVDSLRMIILAEKTAEPARHPKGADDLPRALRIKGRPR